MPVLFTSRTLLEQRAGPGILLQDIKVKLLLNLRYRILRGRQNTILDKLSIPCPRNSWKDDFGEIIRFKIHILSIASRLTMCK